MATTSASAPAPWKGYTEAEWAEIDAAVIAQKLTPLTSAERTALTWMARAYRELAATVGPSPVAVKRWKVVAKSASELREAISEAKKHAHFPDPMWWATWQGYEYRSPEGPPDIDASSIEELLAMFASSAKLVAALIQAEITKHPKKGLRREFLREALRVWFERGGKISLNPDGRLFAYFRAVTGPVMSGAPVPDDTIKSFLKDLKEDMEKAGRASAATIGDTYLGDLFDMIPKAPLG